MKKLRFLKCGLTALMMALAMTLCYSCSSDDDEENQEVNPPSNVAGEINGHAYVELAGYKWATENVGNIETPWHHATYGYYYEQDDAIKAAESWGGTWKLPTAEQWIALMDETNCTWTWQNSYLFNDKTMRGYKVSDKSDSSKFIFLPAAGFFRVGYGGSSGVSGVIGQNVVGYYWLGDGDHFLIFRNFNGDRLITYSSPNPHDAIAVRPVSD